MDNRLSTVGFRTVMARLRNDETFRVQLLGDSPSDAIKEFSHMSDDDKLIVGSIIWDQKVTSLYPIDQKLVLCSSSGY